MQVASKRQANVAFVVNPYFMDVGMSVFYVVE